MNAGRYKWVSRNLDKVKEAVEKGASVRQISKLCGISTTTYYNYRENHPEFDMVIKEAEESRHQCVEHALFRVATGYDLEHREETIVTGKDGAVVSSTEKTTTKHFKPDVKAIEYYLNNRMPDSWARAKQEVSVDMPGVLVVPRNDGDWEQEAIKGQSEVTEKSREESDAVFDD